jgi:hypothetical protein
VPVRRMTNAIRPAGYVEPASNRRRQVRASGTVGALGSVRPTDASRWVAAEWRRGITWTNQRDLREGESKTNRRAGVRAVRSCEAG